MANLAFLFQFQSIFLEFDVFTFFVFKNLPSLFRKLSCYGNRTMMATLLFATSKIIKTCFIIMMDLRLKMAVEAALIMCWRARKVFTTMTSLYTVDRALETKEEIWLKPPTASPGLTACNSLPYSP